MQCTDQKNSQELEVGSISFFRRLRTRAHGNVFVMIFGWRHRDAVDAAIGLTSVAGCPCVNLESGLDDSGAPRYESLGLAMMIFMCHRCSGCSVVESVVSVVCFWSSVLMFNFYLQPQRFLRCSRCWDRLRFPTFFCSRQCQVANYSAHKRVCGRVSAVDQEGVDHRDACGVCP